MSSTSRSSSSGVSASITSSVPWPIVQPLFLQQRHCLLLTVGVADPKGHGPMGTSPSPLIGRESDPGATRPTRAARERPWRSRGGAAKKKLTARDSRTRSFEQLQQMIEVERFFEERRRAVQPRDARIAGQYDDGHVP